MPDKEELHSLLTLLTELTELKDAFEELQHGAGANGKIISKNQREYEHNHDIYRAANSLNEKIFCAEMFNAKSLAGSYLDAASYIGGDKDKFKKCTEKFKDTVKDAIGALDNALEHWDHAVKLNKNK